MSSATRYEPNAMRDNGVGAGGDKLMGDRLSRMGLSPRQLRLNHLWSVYQGVRYAARRYDWDGYERMDHVEVEALAQATFLPPGTYDASGTQMPLKLRKPSAPYGLVTAIVNRFTGLLFGRRRHPTIKVEGDPQTEDFLTGIADAGLLWPAMIQARGFGGAMGSVGVGFQFVNAKPVVEVHDPRWAHPTFKDRLNLILESIEIRYLFPKEERDEKGRWVENDYWYRREINESQDILYKAALAPKPGQPGHGDEPEWEIQTEAHHDLGFCPVVWIQNLPVQDDTDGEPDCPPPVYDQSEQIDALYSQANRGNLANVDPTLVISTDGRLSDIAKGSDNAIKLPKDGQAKYLELAGAGAKAAVELAKEFRARALEVSSCVLEEADQTMAQRTATEVVQRYAMMLEKTDVLRVQYGERGVIPLARMMEEASRKVKTAKAVNGQIVRGAVELPPKYVTNDNGNVTAQPRQLGKGGTVTLKWPDYFEPTLSDVGAAVDAAGKAKQTGLVDEEHAVSFVAPYLHVHDVRATMSKIKSEEAEQARQMQEQMMGAVQRPRNGGGE